MRYRVVVNQRTRPEVFENGEFAEALTLAEKRGGVVLDLWRFEWVYPPSDDVPLQSTAPLTPPLRVASLRIAAGT